MFVKCNLQSPPLDARHSVNQVYLKKPCRQCRCREARIARRNAEKKHFLPRRKNPRAKNIRENLAKPRSARKHKLFRGDPFAPARRNVFHPASLSRIHCLRAEVLHAKPNRILNYGGPCASRHQNTALWLKDAASNAVKPNLRIALLHR